MKLPTIGLSNFTYVILEMKWNEYIFFSKNLHKHKEDYWLPNIYDKKDKERKIC